MACTPRTGRLLVRYGVRHPLIRGMAPAGVAVLLGASSHLLGQQPAPPDADIRGPKPLVEIARAPKPNMALWFGLGGAAAVLALGAVLWYRHAHKRHLASPPETALAALAELEASRETMVAEAFANRAAQTIRQYIAERFGLAAPRRTSEEFFNALAHEASSPLHAVSDPLRLFLKSCDLAKFAAVPLDAGQRGGLLQAARGFINATAALESVRSTGDFSP